ncbi:MAG: hypothetical protein D6729_04585 [Deltaproteobacteria bacterium]|nr:MAG: hypothetical protein D6729_04585 [Deltaproteobacteria bacterium]
MRRFVYSSALCALVLLAGCPPEGDGKGDKPTLTMTAIPDQVPAIADGKTQITVTVTGTIGKKDAPYEGLVLLTTTKGTFLDSGNRSLQAEMVGGTLTTIIQTCDSADDESCAGTMQIQAQAGGAFTSASVVLEPHLTEKACEDGMDDDGDELVDCADPDCEGQPLSNGALCQNGARYCPAGELSEATCSDAVDNDCDGQIDCDDGDCDGLACSPFGAVCTAGTCQCPGTGVEGDTIDDCYDGTDNDCDGLTDGDDSDCIGRPCDAQGNRWSDDGMGSITCGCFKDQDSETNCGDGFDNDCDGARDCQDTDCQGITCTDPSKAPNDVGLTCDANAGACLCAADVLGTGIESNCADMVDNDCDGLVDCADVANCAGQACGQFGLVCTMMATCECPGGSGPETACGDGVDNDCDGDVDCQDTDCADQVCGPNNRVCSGSQCICPGGVTETTCDDNVDNDCDGARDCQDQDCDGLTCAPGNICDYAMSTCIVDPGLNRLTFTSTVSQILADDTETRRVVLTAHVENDLGQAIANQDVTFTVAQGNLRDPTTGNALGQNVTRQTDAQGDVVIHWSPGATLAVAAQASATTVSDPSTMATVTKTVSVKVIGVDTVTVDNIQYATMGTRDSGWQESSLITFRVTGTDGTNTGLPIPDGVAMTYDTGGVVAGGLYLSPTSGVTTNGLGTTTAFAGTQAVSFSVQATATTGPYTASVTTDPINIVGAKPSFKSMTFSCAVRNVNGLGVFGQDSDATQTTVNRTVTCTANLRDRFGNPIQRPDIRVKFISEGGGIESDKPINNGLANTTYSTQGSLPRDVPPMPGEPSWMHDIGGGISIERNPRDGFAALVAYIAGEEEFVDGNGNGDYDVGEAFVDLAEPFLDANDNGTWDPAGGGQLAEWFLDVNGNGQWDGPNGVWDSNTTIWTETRITLSGCAYDNPTLLDGFLGTFAPIPNGGSDTVPFQVGDINLNLFEPGTQMTLSKVQGPPNKINVFWASVAKANATVVNNWGMQWGLTQDCANLPQCVVRSFITPPTAATWGYTDGVTVSDSAPNATEPGQAWQIRAAAGPCSPALAFDASGTSE